MLHLNQTLGIIVCGLYSASKALQLILQTFHRLPFLRLLPAALSISLQAETLLPFELPHSSTLAWENPMDKGAWQAMVHRLAKSWTPLQ